MKPLLVFIAWLTWLLCGGAAALAAFLLYAGINGNPEVAALIVTSVWAAITAITCALVAVNK
jgi:hypothetical protein